MQKNLKICLYFTLIIFGCKSSYHNEVEHKIGFSITHKIQNKKILEVIEKGKAQLFSDPDLYDILMIKIYPLNKDKQNIYIRASNFKIEQTYCELNDSCAQPSGFIATDGIPVLLFGELGLFFDKINNDRNIIKPIYDDIIFKTLEGEYSFYSYEKFIVYNDTIEDLNYKGEITSRQVDRLIMSLE